MVDVTALLNEPVAGSLVFYTLVIGLCELSRSVAARLFPANSTGLRFAYEFIGVLQVCTCVYENGLIVKYYGVRGFWVAVFTLVCIHISINRGAFVNPVSSTEALIYDRISIRNYAVVLLAQILGGYMSYRLARQLWWLGITNDHSTQYASFFCAIKHKVPIMVAGVYEVVGCFITRLAIGVVKPAYRRYMAAFATASLLSLALHEIGVPGLNPIVASARLQGCHGMDHANFFIVYWLCPLTGWVLAALLLDRRQPAIAKKIQ